MAANSYKPIKYYTNTKIKLKQKTYLFACSIAI